MQELPKRFSAAPYQYRAHLPRKSIRPHPAEALVRGAVLIFVPLFWMITIAWFARVVF